MMLIKQLNPRAFPLLESCGMKISPLNEALSKWQVGMSMGLGNLITVLFGIYSVKYVDIPL
jgi:hypothetical protein